MASNRPRPHSNQLVDHATPRCSKCRQSLAEEVYTFQVIAGACKAGVLCAECMGWFIDQLHRANDEAVDELEAYWQLGTGEM